MRKLAILYAIVLAAAAALNYVPGSPMGRGAPLAYLHLIYMMICSIWVSVVAAAAFALIEKCFAVFSSGLWNFISRPMVFSGL